MFQIRIIIACEVENPSKITEIIFRAITHNNFPEMIKKPQLPNIKVMF